MAPIVDGLEDTYGDRLSFTRLNAAQEGQALIRQFDLRGHPAFVVVDAQGRVLARLVGEVPREALEHAIRQALANSAGQSPDEPASGKALYEANCADCHGIAGEGQPNWRIPAANGVYPAPPHNNVGHTWHHPDQVLLEIIAHGGSIPGSAMPAFAATLTRSEMEATLAYIKTFWGPDQRQFQTEVTTAWKQQNP